MLRYIREVDVVEEQTSVSYIAYESAMARLERIIKRLFIICIILIIALIGTNGAWLYYESRFESAETTTITQDMGANSGDAFINYKVHFYDKDEAVDNGN